MYWLLPDKSEENCLVTTRATAKSEQNRQKEIAKELKILKPTITPIGGDRIHKTEPIVHQIDDNFGSIFGCTKETFASEQRLDQTLFPLFPKPGVENKLFF